MNPMEKIIQKLKRYAPHTHVYEVHNIIKGKDKDVESIQIIYTWKKREKIEKKVDK